MRIFKKGAYIYVNDGSSKDPNTYYKLQSMKIIDSLQPEDAVYGLMIVQLGDSFQMIADCKHRDHINDHGPTYHYNRLMATSDNPYELKAFKSVLEKYRKAI